MQYLNYYFKNTPKAEYNSAAISFLSAVDHLSEENPAIARHIIQELRDQRSNLKLIASENYCSLATQLAMGNLLTDKYAEGYPHHRFYAGCANIDAIENIAIDGLKKIFGCDHAYVQPHSGSDANLVAYWSIIIYRVQDKELQKLSKKNVDDLTPEEYEKIRQIMVNQKVMGMSLNSGGHLTHGYRHNISSKMMQSVSYEIDEETGLLNYKRLAEEVKLEKPDILLAGYSAYPRLINFAKMREIADSVGATLMADIAHFAGLVAGKVITGEFDPIPYADIVTSTTHKTLRGPRGGIIMCKDYLKEIVDRSCPLVLGGPIPNVIAAKAVAFKEADSEAFRRYADNILKNAKSLATALKEEGLKLVSGGTDNHLILIDLSELKITGRQAELALRSSGITVNRNTVFNDKNGAWYTSGIRIGTPAITSRGMTDEEMPQIARMIALILKNIEPEIVSKTGKYSKIKYTLDDKIQESVLEDINKLLNSHPLYPELKID